MFKLRVKFFAIIFLVNVLLFGGHYAFLRVGFENSFSDYLNRRERELATILAVQLEEYYLQHNSWGAFTGEDEAWRQFIFKHLRPYFRRLRNEGSRHDSRGDRKQRDHYKDSADDGLAANDDHSRRNRFDRGRGRDDNPIYLLDHNKEIVVGNLASEKDALIQELIVKGKTIGYLGVPLQTEFRDYLDDQFAADHSKHLSFIVLITLLVAFITAIPLSQVMVSRITVLAGHIRKLSRGNYKDSITLPGRDELNELAQHLGELGRTLDKSEQQRKQWVADISHELRTPVAILQADLEAMEDGVRAVDKNAVNRLLGQVQRLKNLVGDLHDLSLTDLGSLTYRKEKIDFNEMVEEAIDLFRGRFEKQGLTFSYQSSSEKFIPVFGDRQRLSQLLLNLLQNSLNYTDAPGKVEASLTVDGEKVLFELNDSAPGVSKPIQARLTERLFRVDDSRSRNSGGAGLGLSICANIAEAHDGKLSFADSALSGLRVRLSLPLYHGATTEEPKR